MAWYPLAVRKELPQNKTQPKISPRLVVLHTAVSSGSSLFSFFNGRSAGVEAHFYVQQDGGLEQYMDTQVRADCQLDGNPYAVSIESWDGANPDTTPWNAKQVASIVALLAWLAKTHRIPLIKATGPQGTGIGYHAQFTTPPSSSALTWNHSHSCPAKPRIAQVPALIEAAKTPAEVDMPLTAAEIDKIALRVLDISHIPNRNDPSGAVAGTASLAGLVGNIEATQDVHYALSRAQSAQLGALKGSLDAVTAALAAHAADSTLDPDALVLAVRTAAEAGAEAALQKAVQIEISLKGATP